MFIFVLALLLFSALVIYWIVQRKQHEARINRIPIRIHVNGIRGKSTVTRLIAGILREAGYTTIAKTTGSAARIIHTDGSETPIKRLGAPTIVEQMRIIKEHATPEVEALVIECMAINPTYQHIAQHQIVQANTTVITNVREDHQDVMGESLLEIADALSNTIPVGGLVITSESRPELLGRLQQNSEAQNSLFAWANPEHVSDEALAGFDYLSFKENIAVGLEVARQLDISADVAIRGMQKAAPDIGAVVVGRQHVMGKELIWAPLFAVNDRESVIASVDALTPYHRPMATRVGILNNRLDRAHRAIQFADIASRDLELDVIVTLGMYEAQVTERLVENGFPADKILNLGESVRPTTDDMLQAITQQCGDQAILYGMVNIHTPQAEQLMEFFEHESTRVEPTPEFATATSYA